jgi:hypothetical protein
MTRETYIEQIRRFIYGGQPDDDAEITIGLVNLWLDQAIGVAAKANWKDSITLDGIAYINNSFYTTFKGLEIEEDEQFLWKVTLPHLPYGIGTSEGISTMVLRDYESRQLTYPVIWMSQNQRSYNRGMRTIPNKLIAYSESEFVFIQSPLILNDYTAQVTMVSGGNSTDLQSTLNVPGDYLPVISEYLKTQFMFERSVPKDLTPDGQDFIKTT